MLLHCEHFRRVSRNRCRRYIWVGDSRRVGSVGSAAFVMKAEFILRAWYDVIFLPEIFFFLIVT